MKAASGSKQNNIDQKIIENMADAFCCFLPDGEIKYANKTYSRLTDKKVPADRPNKFILCELAEYQKQFFRKIGNLSLKKTSFTFKQKSANHKKTLEWLVTGYFNKQGKLKHCSAAARDLSGFEKSMQKAALNIEARFRILFDAAVDTILIMDRDKFVDFNKRTLEMFGCTREQLLSRPPSSFWPQYQPDGRKTRDVAVEKIKAALNGHTRPYELRHCRFDGSLFDTEVTLNFFEYPEKKYLMAIIRDVTERKHAEEIIRKLAYHDTLTGVPNRRLFIDRLENAINVAKRNKQKVALMMFDLDKFKEINDSYGHHVGDVLLQGVARRLSSLLRESDTVGRIGGDEFMIILSLESIHKEDIDTIASKILSAFSKPIDCGKKKIIVTPSIGIAIFPDNGNKSDDLMKCADSAMYRAKKTGRNRYFIFGPGTKQDKPE
jgi:diguanylate cyclase (GGDEF)-like protein/PAS domain S-box-containing protein